MIIEHNKLRTQVPDVEGNLLYIDFGNNDRQFYKSIDLAKTQDPFPECTQAEREQWKEEHKPELEPEPETVESVE